MPFEVERKFLLRNDTWRLVVDESLPMRQGYLNNEVRCSVRVRTCGRQGWLNIKSVTVGAKRQEFEYEIPLADAHQMLDTLCHKPLIEKTRHLARVGPHIWEIDEFAGDNTGLIVAEIELEQVDEAFDIPDWVGEEVTHDVRYYNTSLSRHPYKDW